MSSPIVSWPLPPKRFEDAEHPKYDQIRGRPWFARLLKRKWQLKLLVCAKNLMLEGLSQRGAAESFGLDERELRDYMAFTFGDSGSEVTRAFQDAIDDAYHHYCADRARLNFRAYLKSSAGYFGVKPRHLIEAWETDPFFYPTGYERNA